MEQKHYEQMDSFMEEVHQRNKKRIRFGLKCMYIIPAVFLVLMFALSANGSLKVVFLLLWITSMFVISVALIVVEYVDYNLYTNYKELTGSKEEYRPITDAEEKERILLERMEPVHAESEEDLTFAALKEKGGEHDA